MFYVGYVKYAQIKRFKYNKVISLIFCIPLIYQRVINNN